MHNKKQRLTFFLVFQHLFEGDLFYPKILKRLEEDLSQKERKAIRDKADSIDIDEEENKVKTAILFYCLHVQKPKHGHMSMFTKKLIKETKIDFEPKELKSINDYLGSVIEQLGMPRLEGTVKNFVQNIYYFKPEFMDEYPKLERKITPDS